jgi:hypothetical protein
MASVTEESTLGIMGNANTAWNWKQDYVSGLVQDGSTYTDGLERFSQLSATPDTTALFAGPARFKAIGGAINKLLPIGLSDGFALNQNAQLQRLYEIGSSRAFFTRGKTINSVNFSHMLADQKNIITTLLTNAMPEGLDLNVGGMSAPGADGVDSTVMMNLDSEYTNIPFGLMVVFKTKGSYGTGGRGKVLAAVYLEYCMFQGFQLQVGAQMPVIMEGIGMEFDRVVPVKIT